MRHVGDITKLDGGMLPPVDVITGGSPCQDLSVAGARAGLAGERSGLFMEQVRIVKEMRAADERRGRTAHAVRPRYMVWENVPGAFSSCEGEDFRIVLEEIVRIKDSTCHVPQPDSGKWESAGAIVLGDQFSLAWRVLDAQYWGVAQRRRRIFLVADFAGLSAGKILFEQDRLFGDSSPGEDPRQSAAAPTGESTSDSGRAVTEAEKVTAYAANQRDEIRDLQNVAATLCAQPAIKQQTFIDSSTHCLNAWYTQQSHAFVSDGVSPALAGAGRHGGRNPAGLHAGFCAGAGAAAGGVGYQNECAPTLKASASGNMMPSVLCLNDQGGERMDVSVESSGTLRSQMNGHSPLVFENHGIDSRYSGPHKVAPTMSARYGTGGNNVPLVKQPAIAISGNTIDRQPENGGNGLGCQEDLSYTLTATDRHAVFNRQRVDMFKNDGVTCTQSARQHKDATDLVMDVAGLDCRNGKENGGLCGTLQQGSSGTSINSIHPIRAGQLIRRLTPLECERLQGFPDGWTWLEGASDSARYKALGNSVAIPCVDFVLRGIAYFLSFRA